MAKILIVDDRAINREFLVMLLGYRDNVLLEAADGCEALEIARLKHPDLIITDILMPSMDGYDFVRQLRAEATLAQTPVIFCTAHYHLREAQNLANHLGILHILHKPCEPVDVLRVVDNVLNHGETMPAAAAVAPDYEHMWRQSAKLSREADKLQQTNACLTALVDASLSLAQQREPELLLKNFCQTARELLSAKYACLLETDQAGRPQRLTFTSGMEAELAAQLGATQAWQEQLCELFQRRRAFRLYTPAEGPETLPFPLPDSTLHALLGAPLGLTTRGPAWLCLLGKLGSSEQFDEEAERQADTLAALVTQLYEQANLRAEAARQIEQLQAEVVECQRAAELTQQINNALTERADERVAQLEAANEDLRVFASAFAHDLRAPLLYIEEFGQRLFNRYGLHLDNEGQKQLRVILAAARETKQLVKDLLDFSHAGQARLYYETVNLSALARNLSARLCERPTDRRVDFTVADGLSVKGDADLLHTALENLLDNAWKYTALQPQAKIEFGQTVIEDRPVYFVRDNGVGFELARAAELFQPLRRCHSEADFTGAGLGLTIVQRIIQRHGGDIWAEGAPGSGATFYFVL